MENQTESLEWVTVEQAELFYADMYPELESEEVSEEDVQWD